MHIHTLTHTHAYFLTHTYTHMVPNTHTHMHTPTQRDRDRAANCSVLSRHWEPRAQFHKVTSNKVSAGQGKLGGIAIKLVSADRSSCPLSCPLISFWFSLSLIPYLVLIMYTWCIGCTLLFVFLLLPVVSVCCLYIIMSSQRVCKYWYLLLFILVYSSILYHISTSKCCYL